MRKILVPCDGSDNALRAVQYAASVAKELSDVQLELLYVQDPVLLGTPASLLTTQEIESKQAAEGESILQPAKQFLDAQGASYQMHRRTGPPAAEIAKFVHDMDCDAIIMGTRGFGPIASIMIGSVAIKVIHLVNVPVTLIK